QGLFSVIMCHEGANVVGSVSPASRTETSCLTRLTFHVQAQRRDDTPLKSTHSPSTRCCP
ncbi:hypothetical protein PF001_g33195, partial [Phytophthora fragariae]